MLKIIRRSINHGELLDMIYLSNNGKITKRQIKVFKFTANCIEAYCFLRRSRRTFTVSNVLALVPVRKIESTVV